MKIIVVWLLMFSTYQGHGDKFTAFSPFAYPTLADCKRVGDHSDGGTCVQTHIYVVNGAPLSPAGK